VRGSESLFLSLIWGSEETKNIAIARTCGKSKLVLLQRYGEMLRDELFHADRQMEGLTDRHHEADSGFLQFCESI
jgi:hypothetical protein